MEKSEEKAKPLDGGRIYQFLKGKMWLILAAAAGIMLLLWGGLGESSDKAAEGFTLSSTEEYRQKLSEEVKELCAGVKGVSAVRVVLTLEKTEEAIYAKNKTEGTESVASLGGEGLLLGYALPKVQGVAVVCVGGDDEAIRAELTELLCAALGISSTRVHITAGKIS